MVIEADLGGNVPQYVFRIAVRDAAFGLNEVKKLLPEYLK